MRREQGESVEAYRERRIVARRNLDDRLRGASIWNSKVQKTYIRAIDGEIGTRKENAE